MNRLGSLLEQYVAIRRAVNLSPLTLKSNICNVRAFMRWLADRYAVVHAEELRSVHLRAYQQHLAARKTSKGLSLMPRTINKAVECIRTFLEYLGREQQVPARLYESLDYVKVPDLLPASVLIHEQVKQMIASIDERSAVGYRNRAILELMYSNGVRAGEIVGLDMDRIDFRNATAVIMGKGMKERVVPIGKTALRYLETYVTVVRPHQVRDSGERAVFLNPDGTRLKYPALRQLVKRAAMASGLPGHVTPHTLRRSCTTELLRGGAGMYHVKELLGHTSLDTLKHYARLTITDLRKTHAQFHPREREQAEEDDCGDEPDARKQNERGIDKG